MPVSERFLSKLVEQSIVGCLMVSFDLLGVIVLVCLVWPYDCYSAPVKVQPLGRL